MALTSVGKPRFGGLTTSKSREFSTVYDVVYDDIPTDIIGRALAAEVADDLTTAIPAINSVSNGATLVSKSSQDITGGKGTLWEVTCNYSTDKAKVDQSTPPLSMPANVGYGVEQIAVDMDEDKSPTPIKVRNTAGGYFDPQPQTVANLRIITINKNVTSVGTYLDLVDQINSALVSIDGKSYATGTLLVRNVSSSQQADSDGVAYQAMTITLAANADGWDMDILSVGFEQKKDGKFVKILDDSMQPIVAPRPLSVAGLALDADADPAVLTFKPKESTSFSPITALV